MSEMSEMSEMSDNISRVLLPRIGIPLSFFLSFFLSIASDFSRQDYFYQYFGCCRG